ncbi:phosphoglycerate kinase [Alphaproteobacteria bacterium]|nr:phosphoglycerate kinase [Alphaproteobacteria bacterium]
MKNLNNFPLLNKNILVRVDLNVPVIDGKIKDKTRIIAIKETIQKLKKEKNKIFLISHFGRPNGQYSEKFSLKFICKYLAEELQMNKIHFLENFEENLVRKMINNMSGGEICLFENIRFWPEEEINDLKFAKEISKNFDAYVNEAFSASHRNHASIVGITNFLPSLAGDKMLSEINNINQFINISKKPNLAIIGGSKISSKIEILYNLVEHFDAIAIGGAMANTFLFSQNIKIGKSLYEKDLSEVAKLIIKKAKKFNCEIILPKDVVCADKIINNMSIRNCDVKNIFPDHMILDLGNKTSEIIINYILKSKLVLWNGPLGAFEYKPFHESSIKIANAIDIKTKSQDIISIAGGGDTISAIKMANAKDGFSYISTAGGAFLEWLEGKESPGFLALNNSKIN